MMIWHHVEKGQGRPLVLLHGIGMSSDAWAAVFDRLAVQRRVIAFDIPGFGRTPGLPGTYRAERRSHGGQSGRIPAQDGY